jgi:protein-serine/threonine kinase
MLLSFLLWLGAMFGRGGLFPLLLTSHPRFTTPPPLGHPTLSFHTSLMPSPTLQTRGIFSHSRSSDNLRAIRSGSSTPTSPWKSMFRLGSQSSRKLPSNGISSSITLNTTNLSSTTPPTPNQPLTPASLISPTQRDSSNSSNNSTDSNNEKIPATPPDHSAPSVLVSPSPDASFDAKHSSRSKSDKQQLISRERHSPPATTTATVPSSFFPGPSLSGQRPRPSRSMSATASRLIRRVASAPNAKGLFNLGSRSSVATKNGLLAPATMTPSTTPRGGRSTSHPTSGDGTSSIETISSASSSSRAPRAVSTPALPKVSENDSPVRGANKAAFRRTYSSNSIKVRSVRTPPLFAMARSSLTHLNKVEVGPSSFQKIKLLGRGDVGKVFLVREKKTGKLYAMKGTYHFTETHKSYPDRGQ